MFPFVLHQNNKTNRWAYGNSFNHTDRISWLRQCGELMQNYCDLVRNSNVHGKDVCEISGGYLEAFQFSPGAEVWTFRVKLVIGLETCHNMNIWIREEGSIFCNNQPIALCIQTSISLPVLAPVSSKSNQAMLDWCHTLEPVTGTVSSAASSLSPLFLLLATQKERVAGQKKNSSTWFKNYLRKKGSLLRN